MFTLEQLQSFVVLAEELHFGRAADRLNITQPPLSRQIQKLEQELGFSLFDRARKRVELTRAGVAFVNEADKILTMATASRELVAQIASGVIGELRVGITASGALALLGELLERFSVAAPGVEVSVKEMVSGEQLLAVERGAIDLAFARIRPDDPELASLVVAEEPLIAAVNRRHRLAVSSRPLPIEQLEGERVLRYDPVEARYFRDLVSQALVGHHTRPSQQLTQIHSMIALVAADQGVAIVPASAAKLGMPGVVYRPLRDARVWAQLRAVWRHDNSNPVFSAARSVLTELHESSTRRRLSGPTHRDA